ncbi:MAG: IclR family pca regulon transcriptional regulator [Paracoccaceae bacterium]|jgi:IclR family pca regulon transcriptional regulator
MPTVDSDALSGFAKGLSVIETFGAGRQRQSISQVAAAAGLDRATARRCLLTLAQLGYAEHDGKYFTLTPRVLRLGAGCLAAMPLPQLVQPWIDRLSEEIGQSSSVSILDGPEIVYIARAAQRRVMAIALMPGSRLPAFCTSMGRVLLAALRDAEARAVLAAAPLRARTPRTVTDPDAVMVRIAQVRRIGHALIDQEVEIGLRSIAVPIHDARGRVVAALNVGVAATQPDIAAVAQAYLAPLLAIQTGLRKVINAPG